MLHPCSLPWWGCPGGQGRSGVGQSNFGCCRYNFPRQACPAHGLPAPFSLVVPPASFCTLRGIKHDASTDLIQRSGTGTTMVEDSYFLLLFNGSTLLNFPLACYTKKAIQCEIPEHPPEVVSTGWQVQGIACEASSWRGAVRYLNIHITFPIYLSNHPSMQLPTT